MPGLGDLFYRLRVTASVRFTVVSLLIVIVAALAGMSVGIVTLVPAILQVLFLKDESLAAGLAILTGTMTGALLLFLMTYFWAQVPLFFLVSGLVCVFCLSYWGGQAIRGRWPYLAFPVSAELCLLSGMFGEISGAQSGIDAALIWVQEIPLGLIVCWIVLIGLWPSPTTRDLTAIVTTVRHECANLLRTPAGAIAEGRSVQFVPSLLSLKFFGDLVRTIDLNAWKFRNATPGREDLLARLAWITDIYVSIRYLHRVFEDLPEPGLRPQTREAAAGIIGSLAERIDGRPGADTSGLFGILEQRHRELEVTGEDTTTSRRLSARIAGFIVSARSLDAALARGTPPAAAETGDRQPFFQDDTLRAAARMVIGVAAGLFVFMFTSLPASAYLVIAILIVLLQPNIGRAHLRIRLWFPGVLAGSLWAIAGLYVLSMLPHFGVYLAWMAPGLLVAGYLAAGPDRVSYVGVQIAASMATIMGMAAFPVDNVVSADERVVGAVVGFAIALAVLYLFWPVQPATLLRAGLARNLRAISGTLALLCRTDAPDGEEARSRIEALRFQVQADFNLLYDFSYVFGETSRPAYDYRQLAHHVGLLSMQVWCLREALAGFGADDARQVAAAPIAEVDQLLAGLFEDLASGLERGVAAPATVGEQIDAIRSKAVARVEALAAGLRGDTPQPVEYGVNVVGIMLYHLAKIADAMNQTSAVPHLGTAQLAQLYEGARQ